MRTVGAELGKRAECVPLPAPMLLLDFYVDWCVQCRMQRECLERTCSHYPHQFRLERVNIDTAPELARHHGVSEVPTLLVFRGDQPVGCLTGAQPPDQLEIFLVQFLSKTMT